MENRDPYADNPFGPYLKRQGFVVLDGGLATALETTGENLNDPLWSARVLLERPELVRSVHYDYLRAGADCIATCTYQATVPGLRAKGLSESDALKVIARGSDVAIEARDAFWSSPTPGRMRPIVAASIGPYGAYLADGSEYRGDYGITEPELFGFHEARWHVLARSGASVMACETIPSQVEVHALVRLLDDSTGVWAWFSLSCRDADTLADGTPLRDTLKLIDGHKRIAAIGANCMAPSMAKPLIRAIRSQTDKPIVVYPNSGEHYDPRSKTWDGDRADFDFGKASREWLEAGAQCLGGCCRTTPDTVRSMRAALTA